MTPRKKDLMPDDDQEHDAIVAALRDSIQRQVDSTPAGRRLKAYDEEAMRSLVNNLVGNVYYVIIEFKKKP